ncbi:phycocyanin alpha-subunit phycocyanobilin lyase [Turnera subulata]|uniref:Phycocyanin alpha-subunit phycocyanobilin lyase n=1 Tax=Turnera subulata TaxID=218843 RepID=A0A9Q0FQ67_9ROSI|nr:phycocyanin alpha-subunit phycocyanobilin lyase [Turnera subulata]
MASLQNSPSLYHTLSPNSFPQVSLQNQKHHGTFPCCRRSFSFLVRAEQPSASSSALSQVGCGRRQLIAIGVSAPWISLLNQPSSSFAAETKKGFLLVTDKKDSYSFLYPFGWQEVVIEGQDKVFKDVIEPLESVSINLIPTAKQDIRDFGPPQQVAETLIKKVLAPPSQKTKLVEAKEVYFNLIFSSVSSQDVDGKVYYMIEFIAQAPNFTRHALSAVAVANGKFYTLTTGANERRWEKMKDKLHTIIDSFKIGNA